jgi:hypothetical protein
MIDIHDIYYTLGRRALSSLYSRTACYPTMATYENYYATHSDEYGTWDRSIAAGKSYLVGDTQTLAEFIRTHRSSLSAWQKLAYQWALENPTKKLVIDTGRHEWHVYKRGEFVEFGLPHQDKGGERHYISNNGKSKILVNVD